MKLVVLDGYTENPGDLSWAELAALGELTVYDRTSYTESPLIAERIGDAEIVVMNKTPISRATIDACPNIRLIAVLATGYNVVDYNYAREKGIPVVNVPPLISTLKSSLVVCCTAATAAPSVVAPLPLGSDSNGSPLPIIVPLLTTSLPARISIAVAPSISPPLTVISPYCG